jgi:16S rRNA (adenine1518-N6/adenine1519-N6)-dimethyltransferase
MDLTDIPTIKSLLAQHHLQPNKRLGQHFLVDREVLEEILSAAEISPQDLILEIGAGLGVLTLEMARRAKKVIAVEKDKKLAKILEDVLKKEKIGNVEIIAGDILKEIQNSKFPEAEQARCGASKIQNSYKIVANLPYYLTAAVIRKFLETENPPSEMILMVQKEVAERICARPPKMNLLAVSVQFYGRPEIIAFVSRKSFRPEPAVDSAIIKIKTQNQKSKIKTAEKRKIEAEKFFKIVRLGFSSPRKKLANNLAKILPNSGREKITESLRKIGLRPDCRSQDLSVDNWRKLVSFLKKVLYN